MSWRSQQANNTRTQPGDLRQSKLTSRNTRSWPLDGWSQFEFSRSSTTPLRTNYLTKRPKQRAVFNYTATECWLPKQNERHNLSGNIP